MKRFLLVLAFCCYALPKKVTKRTSAVTMELGEGLEPCTIHGESEISTAESLVFRMFEIYKAQAQSETPSGSYSEDIHNVDGHEVLGRFFVFIYNCLGNRFEYPDENSADLARFIFAGVESDEARWTSDRKWPFRCYNEDTARAFDVFVSDLVTRIRQEDVSLTSLEEKMVFFTLSLALPQFEKYVKNIPRSSFASICEIIQGKTHPFHTIHNTKLYMEAMSPLANVACLSPYNASFYCKFDAIYESLGRMVDDIEQAEDSDEMKKFAFFWLYDSSIAKECSPYGSSSEFVTQVITPYGRLALARLNEIISLSSTTGTDLEKIRTFIYDYSYNEFTRHAEEHKVNHGEPQPPMDVIKYLGFDTDKNKPDVKAEKSLVLCFRAWMSVLLQIDETIMKGGNVAEVKAMARFALFWFLHPEFSLDQTENYNTFFQGFTYIMEHSSLLMRIGKALNQYPWDPHCEEEAIDSKWRKFCQLYRLLVDIRSYTTTSEDVPVVKIMNPSSDYRKILEMESMRSLEAQIAALEIGQEQLEQNLFRISTALGDHFHQLARFDQDKAEYDVGYLQDKIADFTERIDNTGFQDKLALLMGLAIGSNVAELAQLTTQLVAEVASNYNPMKWLSGGGGINDILDRANALAVAGVDTAKLIYIGENLLPGIIEKSHELTKARDGNAVIHDKLNETFHALKNREEIDIDQVQANFLVDYRGYDPGWSQGDIAEYTVLLQEVIEGLCEILYGGGTAASAVVQAVGASKGVCLNIRTDAEVLAAVYNEMYDFQYEFMDAMAAAIRALISKHSANNVRNLPDDDESFDRPSYLVILNLYASQIKLQSKHYILVALKSVCDVDEYKNGGVQTENCKRALARPTNGAINQVIGDQVLECPENKVKWFDVRIPAMSNPNKTMLRPGIIDLTKLYAGKPTEFQIPFSVPVSARPWVQKFISDTVPAVKDIALYLKRFELYLPDTTDTSHSFDYDVEVHISQTKASPIMQGHGETKYAFGTPKVFLFNYGENKQVCTNGFKDSAYPNLCEPYPSQVCISSAGVVSENEIAPSLYSKWLIRVSLPREFPAVNPSPDTDFYLRASFEICQQNPKNVEIPPQHVVSGLPLTGPCCDAGKYYYIDNDLPTLRLCLNCPADSTAKLGGLYCHQNPPEEAESPHHRNHTLRRHDYFKHKFLGLGWKSKHMHNLKLGKHRKKKTL